jgi:RsiW-degrading membrane proteinase PrsW (M82 family)/acetolactate synthase regulatory subunit
MILAVLIAIVIPLIFLYVIWTLEIYAVRRVGLLAASFAWGIAAFFIALIIQSELMRLTLLTPLQVRLYSAPILEETLQALGIFYLARRLYLRYAVDGAAYGFAIGTGFAIAENMLYLSLAGNASFEVAVARVLSVSLLHAYTTGIIGAVAGATIYMRFRNRVIIDVITLVSMILVHHVYNVVTLNLEGTYLIVSAVIIGMGGTGILIAIITFALRAERKWINQALIAEGVPLGDRMLAMEPELVAQMVEHHREEIGAERADLLVRYSRLMAQRGMILRTMSMSQREDDDAALQQQLDDVNRQIDTMHDQLGLYTRVWLQNMLPAPAVSLPAEA